MGFKPTKRQYAQLEKAVKERIKLDQRKSSQRGISTADLSKATLRTGRSVEGNNTTESGAPVAARGGKKKRGRNTKKKGRKAKKGRNTKKRRRKAQTKKKRNKKKKKATTRRRKGGHRKHLML